MVEGVSDVYAREIFGHAHFEGRYPYTLVGKDRYTRLQTCAINELDGKVSS